MKDHKMGLDIGSTTVKMVIINNDNEMIYNDYQRHRSDIKTTIVGLLERAYEELEEIDCYISITGSGGIAVAKSLGINFIQEVIACTHAVKTMMPEADVVIELGGEDAKITYFHPTMEQRMNNNCAGGTGAFIDQMATLLNTDAHGLNAYAKEYKTLYPVASRCGVFAKTDIQPLLNDGVSLEDISASILQAVVNQTIGGLACGKPIKGKVAFLGGPLYFLEELRERFIKTLNLTTGEVLIPEDSQLYVALGTALMADKGDVISLGDLLREVKAMSIYDEDVHRLSPLFKDEEELDEFRRRHDKNKVIRKELKTYKGRTYLGIDAGSTTTKIALIGQEGELLYSYYGNNKGKPLAHLIKHLKKLYKQVPKDLIISKSAVTGYGEGLIQSALKVDVGEIETIAHYKAAKHFLPDVDFILDIGGQDMKSLKIKEGVIDHILLNEACSSGCGSFIEGFASSLGLSVIEFAKSALLAKDPVDLGSKCTVFMNSRVKQAQKEGASIGEISAGLAYSVIKNALNKVIKIKDKDDLGEKIMVQGGTFHNEAVLRAMEIISEREVVRPDIAGLMGAYGAAIIAKEHENHENSHILTGEELDKFNQETTSTRCKSCTNHCLLTIHKFPEEKRYIVGNRCEKGVGQERSEKSLPNLFKYKYNRTFAYTPLEKRKAYRGVIGIPRVLNLYENYPFWHSLLTSLGFRAILSSPSSKDIYKKGLDTIPSEAVCYPAKLSHGHIIDLIEQGIDTIFYPCIVYEEKEFDNVSNHYNCPIVISYPELIKHNIDELEQRDIKLISPFLSLDHKKSLIRRIEEIFKDYGVTAIEAKKAVMIAMAEKGRYKSDIERKGEETLLYLRKHKLKGIVLCGKPYHVDPEINHGIGELINSHGFAVLTEDSISHLGELKEELRVVDQWMYNSRLYRAAAFVAEDPNLELIQLNSFGCGLDSVTSDQIAEILQGGNKMYTLLKIDEGSNLGAAKIRIRSLKAAIIEREKLKTKPVVVAEIVEKAVYTRAMRKTHTILAPQMAPIHFEFIKEAARVSGYKMEILPEVNQEMIDEGLKYVNNDVCYPAIVIIGQIISKLQSGECDIHRTSVIMSQTGGGCRATNYLAILRLALQKAGFGEVPIISLNAVGLDKQPGFNLSLGFINKSIMATLYGDLLMRVMNRTRPYEFITGSSQRLYEKWKKRITNNIADENKRIFRNNIKGITQGFDSLPIRNVKKPKVGVVGEILLKYHPTANHDLVGIIERGGAEAVIPDLIDFFLYSSYNSKFRYKYLGGRRSNKNMNQIAMAYILNYRKTVEKELNKSKRFDAPTSIEKLATVAAPYLSLGNQTGEGWLLTAEMLDFMETGTKNILCIQPMACLPNHITGKGMFKPIKEKYPDANIMAIDYDPGVAQVNQLNRIKLMLSIANNAMK